MIVKTRKAAQLISCSSDNQQAGELGEIILHGLLIDVFGFRPLLSKVYYKTNTQDNVKGFDTVHVAWDEECQTIESLWLGEAKFYKNHHSAIQRAFQSVETFMEAKRLRQEFMVIENYLNKGDEFKEATTSLLNNLRSLDSIEPLICIPILIMYESKVIQNHREESEQFMAEIKAEIEACIMSFSKKLSASQLERFNIHVFFMPLGQKYNILKAFNQRVKGLRGDFK